MALLISGGWLIANMHVITGISVQHTHFLSRLSNPFFFFLASITVIRWVERRMPDKRWIEWTLRAGFVGIVGSMAAHQYVVAANVAPFQKRSDPEMNLVLWMRSHLPPERVVGTTSPRLIALIPALTAEFSYVAAGNRSLTSTPEIFDRYYQLASFTGLTEAEVARIARQPGKLHPSELLLTFGLRPKEVEGFIDGYKSFLKNGGDRLRYRLDYLILPASAEPITGADRLYQNKEFQLFSMRAAS
jgi:hypothetical protein